MAQLPETRYAKGPGGDIAYQVVGDGPMDLVVVPGWFSHVDLLWNHPGWASFIGDFASFSRVILYDKLGTGLSDPVDAVPTLESRVDDLRAVMDAADSQRAALFGLSEGGPIGMLFAATYPKRVQALILYGTYACGTGEDDGSPGRAKWLKLMNAIRPTLDHWGGGHTVDWAAPSLQPSAPYRKGMGALERAGMSPKMARLTFEAVLTQVDVRDILGNDEITREEISRFQGREVKHTGDGFLAAFDGPTRAVRCATTLTERMPELGIDIRTGLHAGECEVRGEDIGGIAVHIGARIAALARGREVLVSSTVKDLVNGSGITFEDRGTHVLKGIPAQWQLYAPVGEHDPAGGIFGRN